MWLFEPNNALIYYLIINHSSVKRKKVINIHGENICLRKIRDVVSAATVYFAKKKQQYTNIV